MGQHIKAKVKRQIAEIREKYSHIDTNLPWRSTMSEQIDGLDAVEAEFRILTLTLNAKQKAFVLIMIEGNGNKTEAYRKAGYSQTKNATSGAIQVMSNSNIVDAIKIGRIISQMRYGIDAQYKRQVAVNMLADATDKDSEGYNVTNGLNILKYLSDLDGDIAGSQQSSVGPVKIVINTGMPERITTTVNAESTEISNSKPKAIEE